MREDDTIGLVISFKIYELCRSRVTGGKALGTYVFLAALAVVIEASHAIYRVVLRCSAAFAFHGYVVSSPHLCQ